MAPGSCVESPRGHALGEKLQASPEISWSCSLAMGSRICETCSLPPLLMTRRLQGRILHFIGL